MNSTAVTRLLSSGLLLLVLGASTACTTVNTVERSSSVASPNYVSDKRVITDASLGRAVSVVSVNTATVSGNLLKVQATLRNNKSSARNVSYVWEWIDIDGMTVSTPTAAWKSLRLLGKETKTMTSVAPSPRAVDFVLKMQEAK